MYTGVGGRIVQEMLGAIAPFAVSVRLEYMKLDLEIGKGSSAKWKAGWGVCDVLCWLASFPNPGKDGTGRIENSPLN
jgi:hypothetical protein